MKLDVPFYLQEKITDCGSTALKMILDFFGTNFNKDEITKLSYVESNGATWTIGLANAAAKLGFKTEFYSIFVFNEENYELDFYKKYSDGVVNNEDKIGYLINLAKKLNVKIVEKN